MDFNIRAISYAESVGADEHVDISELLGRRLEFRSGKTLVINLPSSEDAFASLGAPNVFSPTLLKWARVFQAPAEGGSSIHVLSKAEMSDGSIAFRRIEMFQPTGTRRNFRPPVQFLEAEEMNYDRCGNWLTDLAEVWEMDAERAKKRLILARPQLPRRRTLKFAWIGPDLVEGHSMKNRLKAIGQVRGADLVHILPFTFPHVRGRLKEQMPLAAAIIARHYAPHIAETVVPEQLNPSRVLMCDSTDRAGLEQQITTWIDLTVEQIENERGAQLAESEQVLALMLKGMMSHSKIGQFMHCDRTTVFTAVRAQGKSIAIAEEILDKNCEQYQDNKQSEKLFLWKDHNEGRRYFLNPKRVEDIKAKLEQEA